MKTPITRDKLIAEILKNFREDVRITRYAIAGKNYRGKTLFSRTALSGPNTKA